MATSCQPSRLHTLAPQTCSFRQTFPTINVSWSVIVQTDLVLMRTSNSVPSHALYNHVIRGPVPKHILVSSCLQVFFIGELEMYPNSAAAGECRWLLPVPPLIRTEAITDLFVT